MSDAKDPCHLILGLERKPTLFQREQWAATLLEMTDEGMNGYLKETDHFTTHNKSENGSAHGNVNSVRGNGNFFLFLSHFFSPSTSNGLMDMEKKANENGENWSKKGGKC